MAQDVRSRALSTFRGGVKGLALAAGTLRSPFPKVLTMLGLLLLARRALLKIYV